MIESRAVHEFRASPSDRTISGIAMPYNRTARIGSLRERFQPGAFGSDVEAQDVRMDVQHDRSKILARTNGGGLSLSDSSKQLRFRAELPGTREADDVLELVARSVLRGASVEFVAREEHYKGRVRHVAAADLISVSVVDSPAYKNARIETRQRPGRGLSGSYKYGRLHITSATGKVRKTRLKAGALNFAVEDVTRDIPITFGSSLNSTLGTRATARFSSTSKAVGFSLAQLPDTTAARDLVGLRDAGVPLYARPVYSIPEELPDGRPAYADVPEEGNPDVLIREVREGVLHSFMIGVRSRDGEYEPVQFTRRKPSRRRYWL